MERPHIYQILIAVFAVAVVGLMVYAGTPRRVDLGEDSQNTYSSATAQTQTNMDTSAKGLDVKVIEEGTGAVAENGQIILMQYTGKLTDGTVFDSSIPRGEPFSFRLGAGQVIKGWDVGILGMKVGGKRTLTIPPEMGYGADGFPGVIPPNATLIFDVELVGIK